MQRDKSRKNIAVVGTGIAGMSAAWLLSAHHDVTVYEQASRPGGHSNTVTVQGAAGDVAIDTGFIVYNEATYPNLTALFDHLGVPTQVSEMSFAVSLADGNLEYSGGRFKGLFAQPRNVLRPRFWSMLSDLQRFYREAPRDLVLLDGIHTTLGDYLDAGRYGSAFRNDHLLPMAGAIWSAPARSILGYPAASFIRFHDNHGLLKLRNRPQWRTVVGGSRVYVEALTRRYADRISLSTGVRSIKREGDRVSVQDRDGGLASFDEVVIAAHADQALSILSDADEQERSLLSCFRYSPNRAVLHSDPSLMPKRRAAWSSWNYICRRDHEGAEYPMVTYWMNALQNIATREQWFVTLNPEREPRHIWHSESYDHPLFNSDAIGAQQQLWSLQGRRNTWFCGSYCGAGFHEDGLQAGLAVAEALGGMRRPWSVEKESGRIVIHPAAGKQAEIVA
jgi:predicted NAD/FAD-binding protein